MRPSVVLVVVSALACGGSPPAPVEPPRAPVEDAPATAAAGTLCTRDEEALLTCDTAAGTEVGLCLRGETLRFRVRERGAAVVEHPTVEQRPDEAFSWQATVTHGGMGRPVGANDSTLSFTADGATYTLHERLTTDTPTIDLTVTHADGTAASARCDHRVEGNLVYVAGRVMLPIDEAL